jgi:hypothetical protein
MATTTTNFGWDIPQSTDLVKDGATAIAALGQDIDTALVDLKGGTTGQVLAKASGTDLDFSWVAQDDSNAIQNAIVDAKGDLIAATANDTPARLAVGTNGQVLTADSTAATGLAWATAASGGMTLLSTTTLSGANTTISSISGSYNKLVAYIYGVTNASANYEMTIQANGTGSLTYAFITQNVNNIYNTDKITNADIKFGGTSTQTGVNSTVLEIDNYAQTSHFKPFQWSGYATTSGGDLGFAAIGGIKTNSAISSLKFIASAGTFNAGTVLLYGVK